MGVAPAFLRNTWRGLTSMRTALVLLFLLALGALPGALLPQRSLNASKVNEYLAQHNKIGPLLDKAGFFAVYASTWFAAIYVLLFVSLVGCLLPRTVEYARQALAKPVLTPRNLGRLPHHARAEVPGSVDDVIAAARTRLRGWRLVERTEEGGARTLSTERGYLRETGNLVFHFAVLGLLISFAVGKLYSYEGQVIVIANGAQFCNSGTLNYDTFRPGLRVDGTQLDPLCVRVNDFHATYLATGQADNFRAGVSYQSGPDLDSGTWRPYQLEVNQPLRTAGDRVYLTGHGYAPVFTVTFPDGTKRTKSVQWLPTDMNSLLSQGTTTFDPPGLTDQDQFRQHQIAITGLFAPTAAFAGSQGKLLTSAFPDQRDPAIAVDVYVGDLGNNSGQSQSIFTVDQAMIDQGRLKKMVRENRRPGEEIKLDDGTRIHFDGVEQWVALQVSHDPSQTWVLGFGVLVIGGIAASLTIKRRRLWVRATPADGGTVVEIGGLARTDQAGYGEEFTRLSGELLAALGRRD